MSKNLDRRSFLKTSTIAISTLTTTSNLFDNISWAITPHQKKDIIKIDNLKTSEPVYFFYPDNNSPAVLIKLNEKALGGIGKNSNIVAYSMLCTHKGCTVQYKKDNSFLCPCHLTKFDATKNGQIVIGQATENLPQIELEITKENYIQAKGVKTILYGKFSN